MWEKLIKNEKDTYWTDFYFRALTQKYCTFIELHKIILKVYAINNVKSAFSQKLLPSFVSETVTVYYFNIATLDLLFSFA